MYRRNGVYILRFWLNFVKNFFFVLGLYNFKLNCSEIFAYLPIYVYKDVSEIINY